MSSDPLSAEADAATVAAAVNRRDVSPHEVVRAAIDRVRRADAELSFLMADRFQAALSDAGDVDVSAPLAGVPVLLKDFLATCAGMPYTEGSRYPRDWIAPVDSEYVARLRRAGAIVVGIVKSPEMALSSTCEPHRYGPVLNPRAPGRTTGGSSGGAGAAVAAGAVPAAHGNDAAGSIRIPASCCGVFGLKPTRARNPLGPEYGDLGAGIWAEHMLTRTVRDSAAFLDATHGPGRGDPYAAPPVRQSFRAAAAAPRSGLRVAFSTASPVATPVDAECRAAVERTVGQLGELGHHVSEAAPSLDFAAAERDFFNIFCAGLAAQIDRWTERLGRPPHDDDLEPYTWGLLAQGRAISAAELLGAITRLQSAGRRVADFHAQYDVWLTPTLAQLPVPLGYFEIGPGETAADVLARDAAFTPFLWIANFTGQPAMSFPAHSTADGIPVGVQVIAPVGDESTLFGLAAQLEASAAD